MHPAILNNRIAAQLNGVPTYVGTYAVARPYYGFAGAFGAAGE